MAQAAGTCLQQADIIFMSSRHYDIVCGLQLCLLLFAVRCRLPAGKDDVGVLQVASVVRHPWVARAKHPLGHFMLLCHVIVVIVVKVQLC